MMLVWVFTWFSYWLFLKNQVNPVNIFGTATSAGLMAFIHFSHIRVVASKALRIATPQINKGIHLSHAPHIVMGTQTSRKPQLYSALVLPKSQVHSPAIKVQKVLVQAIPPQITRVEPQKQEEHTEKVTAKSPNPQPQSNGCPKNLDYYTKKPRPKQTPEDCISCKNLIQCVCLTND